MGSNARAAAVMVAISASALMAAAPAGASRADCAAAARGGRVIEEGHRGLVYVRGARAFSCSYPGGRVNRLPGQGRRTIRVNGHDVTGRWVVDQKWVRMAARYVAYGLHFTETRRFGRPYQTARVVVFDVPFGTTHYSSGPSDAVDPFVDGLVVKPDGSVAWMYAAGRGAIEPYHLVVKMDRASGGAERGLDGDDAHVHGYRIHRGSLALSTDGRHVYWTASMDGDPEPHHLRARLR
jgi:hypothetical protein